MPKDAELDRLKTARDSAFERKQAAWQAQDQAWKRRSSARDGLARTREDKQRAYEVQQAAWEYLQSVRNRNGPRIDQLNREQETAYQRMRDSFEQASAAHASRDGASARRYADDGHAYKAESQRAVAERRRLVEEIRDAKSRHDATKPGFQRAKDAHARAQADFNSAKAEHERLKSAFQTTKAEFERAKQAFETRLASVRSANEQRRSEKRQLARQAGVPSQYIDDVWVTTKPDGTVHFYFGGVGSPDGPGHGHYVMETSGHISYRRDPFDPHGAHNHTDHERRQRQDDPWEPSRTEPPHVGVIAGTDQVVSFKTGGSTGDHTLIADGDFSDRPAAFDGEHGQRGHSHYGSKQEKGEHDPDRWIDQDRGKYTGPDH